MADRNGDGGGSGAGEHGGDVDALVAGAVHCGPIGPEAGRNETVGDGGRSPGPEDRGGRGAGQQLDQQAALRLDPGSIAKKPAL